jgi:CDP-diglyceride synthetase
MDSDRLADPNRASVIFRSLAGLGIILGTGLILAIDHVLGTLPVGSWQSDLLAAGPLVGLCLMFLLWLALGEYANLAAQVGMRIRPVFLIPAGLLFFAASWCAWAFDGGAPAVQPWTVLAILLLACCLGYLGWQAVAGKLGDVFRRSCGFVFAIVYVVIPFVLIAAIRVRWNVAGLFALLAVCKITDIGAYYGGKIIGGPRLAPRVSPHKTWAGAGGGILAAFAMSLLLKEIGILPPMTHAATYGYGIMLPLVTIIGDLGESAIKREAGIKDSGILLKGYGGVLDMTDGLLFAAPFTYIYFTVAG